MPRHPQRYELMRDGAVVLWAFLELRRLQNEKALLVRAADVEARRQRAHESGDLDAQRHCGRVLALRWRRYGQLERRAGQ